MLIPDIGVQIFAAIGIFTTVYMISLLTKYVVHWYRFGELPLSQEHEKIIFLRKQIEQQDDKIIALEKETEKMTMALLQHLS
jgi:hypothetical protein